MTIRDKKDYILGSQYIPMIPLLQGGRFLLSILVWVELQKPEALTNRGLMGVRWAKLLHVSKMYNNGKEDGNYRDYRDYVGVIWGIYWGIWVIWGEWKRKWKLLYCCWQRLCPPPESRDCIRGLRGSRHLAVQHKPCYACISVFVYIVLLK